MAANKQTRRAQPTPDDADVLRRAIHALGDYGHVSVRAARGHLTIFVDAGTPVARASPLGRRPIWTELPYAHRPLGADARSG